MKRKINGMVLIEIITSKMEGFINILCNNGILLRNVKKKNINSAVAEIWLSDYERLYKLSRNYGVKVRIQKKYTGSFITYKWKKRSGLILGVFLFFATLYFLSTFIWTIDITSGKYITPYEIRRDLKSLNIKPGMRAKDIDVYQLERKMMEENSNISYIKIRKEAGALKVIAQERQEPPNIEKDNASGIIVASRDAEIIRVYTVSGKAIVKKGDIVKKGETLVLNQQGREGEEYEINAVGTVIGKTFYENSKTISLIDYRRDKTGKEIVKYYIDLFGKRYYLKNIEKTFTEYDKIEDSKLIFGKETYYEVEKKPYYVQPEYAVKKAAEELFSEIELNFDSSVKVVDKIVYKNVLKDRAEVNLVVAAEENIAVKKSP